MPSLHRLADRGPTTHDSLTDRLVTSAAALESALRDAESRIQLLTHELRALQQREAQAVKGIRTISKSHRNQSHSTTTRVIQQILAALKTDRRSI